MADPAIASSTLKQHHEEVVKQLNNPVVVARLLVLEGVLNKNVAIFMAWKETRNTHFESEKDKLIKVNILLQCLISDPTVLNK